MTMNIVLLFAMTVSALWAVMARSLLKGTIGLALTSAIITILMFRLNAPLAAVFELSVCAGLITVIFVSAISLTKPLTHKEIECAARDRMKRFIYLPVIIVIAAVVLYYLRIPNYFAKAIMGDTAIDVRTILWGIRHFDIFGQIALMIAGALGVVILFKEANK
ncbi:MAG: hydrogenase subunit MbhD domain-containing protein [Candidatus Omnitrophota bacterium]